MNIVESISSKLNEIKDIEVLDNIEGKMALESGYSSIKNLLDDKDMNVVIAQKISVVIVDIKNQIYSDITKYKEFIVNGGESYIKLLDNVTNYINKNIIELFDQEAEKTKINGRIKKTNNYKVDGRIKPIRDKVDEYFEHITKIFGISNITRENYDTKLEDISLVGMEREKLEEILVIFVPYSKDLKYSRYLHVNPIVTKQLKSRISQLKNKEAVVKERQEKLKNINSIKKTIPQILKNIEEFKNTIKGELNNINDFNKVKEIIKKEAEDLIKKNEGFLNDIKLKGDTSNNERIKFEHQVERGVSIYTKLNVDQIKTGLERGFFWGEIDELIENLNRI